MSEVLTTIQRDIKQLVGVRTYRQLGWVSIIYAGGQTKRWRGQNRAILFDVDGFMALSGWKIQIAKRCVTGWSK